MSYQSPRRYRDRDTYMVPTPRRLRSSEHRMHFGILAGILVILALVVVALVSFHHYEYGTEHMTTFTIASLDDQASGNSHQYLIFTKDGRTFADKDAIFHGKMNSSDIWAQLRVGHTYTCDVYGWRNHFLSTYPDIIWCRGVAGAAANATP